MYLLTHNSLTITRVGLLYVCYEPSGDSAGRRKGVDDTAEDGPTPFQMKLVTFKVAATIGIRWIDE